MDNGRFLVGTGPALRWQPALSRGLGGEEGGDGWESPHTVYQRAWSGSDDASGEIDSKSKRGLFYDRIWSSLESDDVSERSYATVSTEHCRIVCVFLFFLFFFR